MLKKMLLAVLLLGSVDVLSAENGNVSPDGLIFLYTGLAAGVCNYRGKIGKVGATMYGLISLLLLDYIKGEAVDFISNEPSLFSRGGFRVLKSQKARGEWKSNLNSMGYMMGISSLFGGLHYLYQAQSADSHEEKAEYMEKLKFSVKQGAVGGVLALCSRFIK